ncbi:conserved hypothetical protein [Altererythrobacter sp. B11]|uniref:glycerophosphodiester phosphodiesterase family protein n=1 Tax=Altererythrobacter sp. B11 TaxID=2060312 RepID=UPI000DC73267|nr:glycerophosphodiester phosphodiesterase family protein [Altererythrobacter sp. B11]BBC74276.1 conserved hypothetical protein [Altererythrobacter sp. B11]
MQCFCSVASLADRGWRAALSRAAKGWADFALRAFVGTLVCAILWTVPAAAGDDTRKEEIERRLAGPDGTVMVVAHRACWKGSSENSINAIRACIAAGIDMVELDVRATRDGKLVLMHDATVDRMTNGSGKVADLNWATLSKLRLRQGNGLHDGKPAPLTARRIPTFEEALRAASDRILINVDAKVPLSPAVLALVDAVGGRRQILFKAEATAEQVQALAPWVDEVRFMPILREPGIRDDPAAAIAAYDPLHPVAYEVDVKDRVFAPGLTPIIRPRCARYWVNSLSGRVFSDTEAVADPDAVWGRLVDLGVDAIQTDEPIMLKTYLRQRGRPGFSCPAP